MATRAQQMEILAAGVIWNGSNIAVPYAAFYAAGTVTPKNAFADLDKSVAITKKALDTQGRAIVYGDGIYKIRFYDGDPDASGVLKFEIDNYKVTAVTGNSRTITSDTTGSDDDSLILGDTSTATVIYTLPSAVLMAGRTLTLKKISAANTFTYTAFAGENIDGASSGSLFDNNATIQVISNGVNWYGAQLSEIVSVSTNLAGGEAGVLPYQSATDVTAFTTVGTAGQVLQSNATAAPTWVDPATIGKIVAHVSGLVLK